MLRYIMEGDTISCINMLEEIIVSGRDLTQFIADFTWYLRNIMLVKTADNMDDMLEMSAERVSALKEEASQLEMEVVMRYIRILSELLNQIKYAKGKRVLVEIALIKMAKPDMEKDYDSIVNRLSVIEKKMKDGIVVAGDAAIANTVTSGNIRTESQAEESTVKYEDAAMEEVKDIVDNWRAIISGMEPPLNKYLRGTVARGSGGNGIIIEFNDDFSFTAVSRDNSVENLENSLAKRIQKQVKVQLKQLSEASAGSDVLDAVKAVIKMDIIEEEN